MKWYEEIVWPVLKRFCAHASTCPKAQAWAKCQQYVIETKGQFELKMIQTSDDEFIEELNSFNPQ